MISIRKHLDEPSPFLKAGPFQPDLLKALSAAYQSALAAMSRAATRTLPQLAPALEIKIEAPSPGSIAAIDRQIVAELDAWGERASSYFRQKTDEVKEILLLVTKTAQSTGEKDERYKAHLTAFSIRLKEIASLDDLTQVRKSISQSALDLKACADKMADDGKAMITRLQSDVATYQVRLEEAERQALLDPLTALENRRGLEKRMAERMAQGRPFSIILFDLNHFKQINDVHGHPAGDELLKQFASELRYRFRAADSPGRWGGDEFMVVFEGNAQQAQVALCKASDWLFGDYTVLSKKVSVSASAGIAEWNGQEPIADTLQRADLNMYEQKQVRFTA